MADIREAAMQGAGMVEIRFDFLRTKVEDIGLRSIPLLLSVCRGVGLPVLATFRPRWEDPNAGYSGQDEPRLQALQLAGHHGAAFVDVERKSMPMWKALGGMPRGMRAPARLVVSDHNFERLDSLDELRALAAEMRKLAGPEGVVKIAQSCGEDITAAARMATLAATTAGPMVCLAMGQGGMFTRILAPKFGALFTFGCLTGKRSAPGQPTVGQMIEEFRVADMTRDTKVLALCTRVKSNRLLTSPSSGRLCTVANAGLAAASVDAMCVPIQLPTGCMREEFEDLLPPGTFVALMMDPIVVTSRLDKAADIYRQVAGAPPGGEALAAMDRSAQ
uniref:3-dehydroquinate dehydratase n=1 Tax=Zooxanthella nutricula TaxID=1333877 RepID=A0A7S2NZH2_9DINO